MLNKNDVFRWQNADYRLLGVVADQAYLFPMSGQGLALTKLPVDELETAIQKGSAEQKEDPYFKLQFSAPKGKAVEKMQKNYEMLKPLLDLKDELLVNPQTRTRVLNEISLEGGQIDSSKRRRAVRLLTTYWRKGQCETALAPEYGHNTNPRNCRRKPGRRFRDEKVCPPPLNDELRQLFGKYLDKYVLKEDGLSIAKAYAILVTDYVSTHDGCTKDTAPSINQFRYFSKRYRKFPERLRATTGAIEYAKDKRTLAGSTYSVSDGIGRVYEVDSTKADVYLVASDDRTELIGRPTLYIVTDRYSRMIVGMHIAVEDAQFTTAAEALVCAFSDKQICKDWDDDFKQADWPVMGLPHTLTADNGELAGRQIEAFGRSCNVWINNTQAYRGDQKSTVERSIGLVQDRIRAHIAAKPEKASLKKEGAKEKRTLATLTIGEYRKLVLNAIVDLNNRALATVPPGYPLRGKPTPLAVWQWCLKPNGGKSYLQRRFTSEQLRRTLLPRFEATVSRRGITAEQLTYHCERAAALGWFERDRHAPRPEQPYLAIDPNNVGNAWLFESADMNPADAWPCTLTEQCAEYKGKPLFEARHIRKIRSEIYQETERESRMIQGKMFRKNEQIAKSAKDDTPKPVETASERLQAIADNRRKERKRIASENNPQAQEPRSSPIAQSNPYAYPDDFEDLDN